MTFHSFFSLTTGISRDLKVPTGTTERICTHIEDTEKELGLSRQSKNNKWRWGDAKQDMIANAAQWASSRHRKDGIEAMSQAVLWHNEFVRGLYADLGKWAAEEPAGQECETLTVETADGFWGGLQILDFPKELWNEDHFSDHMSHLYTLLKEGESRGVSLNCDPLTPQQISALLPILESELDQWGFDLRFEIPLDENLDPCDFLVTGDDYDWCGHCGPIHVDASYTRCQICPRAETGECDLKNEGAWFDEE